MVYTLTTPGECVCTGWANKNPVIISLPSPAPQHKAVILTSWSLAPTSRTSSSPSPTSSLPGMSSSDSDAVGFDALLNQARARGCPLNMWPSRMAYSTTQHEQFSRNHN